MFRGRFTCSIDQKGRLQLPVHFRRKLGKGRAEFVVTNTILKGERGIDVYTAKDWQQLEKRIGSWPQFNPAVQEYTRFYLSAAIDVEMDKSHRLQIPRELREFASLENKIVCVGMGERIEVWSEKTWQTHLQTIEKNFSTTMQSLAHLEHELKLEGA